MDVIRKYLTPEAEKAWDLLLQEHENQLTANCEMIERKDEDYISQFGFDPRVTHYTFEEWKNMKEGCVYVMNYPKTGNHWIFEIVRCLLYANDEEQMAVSNAIPNLMHYIDFPDRLCCEPKRKFEVLDLLPLKRHAFCGHLPEALFDFNKMKQKKGKVIYVIRNPKDQAASWYHFTRTAMFKKSQYPSDWDTFLEEYLQGKHHLWTKEGEWYLDHVLDWWKHKNDEDVLFVHFENMKTDQRNEIKRIAGFIEVDASEDTIDEVIKRTSIKTMRKREDVGTTFARKGEVAGWKKLFTVAQSELMDKLVDEKLEESGLKFIYT